MVDKVVILVHQVSDGSVVHSVVPIRKVDPICVNLKRFHHIQQFRVIVRTGRHPNNLIIEVLQVFSESLRGVSVRVAGDEHDLQVDVVIFG